MFLIELKIGFDSDKEAKIFFKSIEPELVDFLRSETKISQKGPVMNVIIKAADKSSMRASFNSVIKPLILFNNLEKVK